MSSAAQGAYIRSLFLRNWRLYEEAFFEFSPFINCIVGPNAQGKTSLLEALYYLISGRSCRQAQGKELMREGASHFYLEACFVRHDLEQKLTISFDGKERKILYNQTLYPSATSLLGLLKGVILMPDDSALIKGSPLIRRQFIDCQIAQTDPLYVHHLLRYMRAMRQRNCLLKAKERATLEVWEKEMAHSAAYITLQRLQAVEDLEAQAAAKYAELSQTQLQMKLKYKEVTDPKNLVDYFQERYARLRAKEMAYGFTLFGPHRDELHILLNDKEARLFASEGQQRTCVAALRFAEWERLLRVSAEKPLMLLDDVGLSLDAVRSRQLLEQLKNLGGQTFLTATQELPLEGHCIKL